MQLTLADKLTLSRIACVPLFLFAFAMLGERWSQACLILFGLCMLTDLLDGYVARRWGKVSSVGKLIDPLADSVSRFSVFLAFTTELTVRGQPWPVLLVALVFYRDAIVAYTRTFAASTGVVLAARFSGKFKAVVQGGGIIIFLVVRAGSFYYAPLVSWRRPVFYVVMIPIVVVTVWSAFDYVLSSRAAFAAMSSRDE